MYKIATYNVQNLFLHGEGEPKPEQAVRPLVRMVDQVQADVLLLQEVGSAASLRSLNERLRQPYAHIRLLAGNSDRSIHLALLSRLRFTAHHHREVVLRDEEEGILTDFASLDDAEQQRRTPLRVQRDIPLVEFDDFALFGVHLKSRTNNAWRALSAETIRRAECQLLAQLATNFLETNPGKMVLAAGDFNDNPSARALGSLADVFVDPMAARLKRAGKQPTTYWPKRRMRMDRILIDRRHAECAIADSASIHANRMAETASDHYPVSLQIEIP